jgi:N-methylhydantoinase A
VPIPVPPATCRGGTEPHDDRCAYHRRRGPPRARSWADACSIDGEAARRAFEPLAERFALSVEQAASSALQLADANIVRAIQLVSTERGRDPRDYALVPFGGAGPLHAARIAEELGISTIVVPPNAGVISAYGLVASDYTKFDAVTRKMKLDDTAAREAGRIFGEMRDRLAAQFAEMKLPGTLDYTHTLDMRFVGQAFEVGVEIPADRLGSLDATYLAELFADAHHRTFMHGANLDRPVEIVTLRVGATLPIGGAPKLDREKLAARAPEQTKIFHDEAWLDCDRYTAEALAAGQQIVGPAVIEGYTATTWVPPGWTAGLDEADNLILRRSP